MTATETLMCCPRCGNPIEYDEEWDGWMCAECDIDVDISGEDVACPESQP